MSRKQTLAINNIKKSIICLQRFKPNLMNSDLRKIGINKIVADGAFSLGLHTILDIENAVKTNTLSDLYGDNSDKLYNLSKNILKACEKYLKLDIRTAIVDLESWHFIGASPKSQKKKNNIKIVSAKNKTVTSSSFLNKFYNFENAKRFSMKYFKEHFGPFFGGLIPGANHHKIIKVKLKSGFIFNAYSKEERSFLRKLDKEIGIVDIKGGNFGIEVSKGANLLYTYYPDVYIQTSDGKIGLIEIKPLYDMCDEDVLDKWKMLKQFCRENGYMCFIGNQAFSSYPELSKRKIPESLISAVRKEIKSTGVFNYEDYKLFKKRVSIKTKDLDVALSAFCYTRHFTFRLNAYGYRQFSITKEQ